MVVGGLLVREASDLCSTRLKLKRSWMEDYANIRRIKGLRIYGKYLLPRVIYHHIMSQVVSVLSNDIFYS